MRGKSPACELDINSVRSDKVTYHPTFRTHMVTQDLTKSLWVRGAVIAWLERLTMVQKVADLNVAGKRQGRLTAANGEDWTPPFKCCTKEMMGLVRPNQYGNLYLGPKGCDNELQLELL